MGVGSLMGTPADRLGYPERVSPPELSPPLTRLPPNGQAFFVLGLSVGLLAALAIDRGSRFYFDQDLELVRSIRDLALEEYVHPVDREALIDDAVSGMLAGLDDYSTYYGPPKVAALERETRGEFLGIGVVFRAGELGRILFSYPDSPAAKAGLRVGDRILRADGRPIAELESGGLRALLHEEDSAIRFDVEGLDGAQREVVLSPDVVIDPTVRHGRVLVPTAGIGYVAIRSFSHHTPQEFDASIAQLRQRGLQALVLDVRDNPGGILDAAVAVANRFVDSGSLVATRSRDETRVTMANPERAALSGMPLVLLVDRKSASASEVLAAALQDHAVAVLLGEPTWGKGMVQTLKHIGHDQAVVKLTTASYCSPSLRRIEHDQDGSARNGIAPDVWLPLATSEREAVHRFLDGYSPPESALEALRGWEEREDLALVESPPSDRQLDAAVALLSGEPLELHGDPLR